MRKDRDEPRVQRGRTLLEELLADCNSFLAEADHLRQRRPDLAPRIAPDELIEFYTQRQWAVRALAALDAGEGIPPPSNHL
jgi:hypothetical protein